MAEDLKSFCIPAVNSYERVRSAASMGLADQKELAPKGLIRLVIYPREVEAKPAPKPMRRRIPWVSSIMVFLLSAGVTFAAVYVHQIWSTSVPSTQTAQSVSSGQTLGLQVQYEGERLLVTWNRGSPAARSAVQGVLRIDDAGQHRDLVMDSTQIVAGSVLYKPASADVGFRLEVRNDRGAAVVESIRVLDAAKPQPAAQPEQPRSDGPAPAPEVPQTRTQTLGLPFRAGTRFAL
jgi:hypothetical protein